MKNTKKIIAAVLTVIMMISMLPSNVFATEPVENDAVESAVEAVSISSEEQETETTVEDISEDQTEVVSEEPAEEASIESSDKDETEETADPAAEETETSVEETVENIEEADAVTDSPVTLKAEGDDYVVTVTYDASALLPEDVKIEVEEILDNARKYDSYCDQALEAVQKENKEAEEISYIRLFDITLVDGEGNKVQPKAAVDVQIRLKDVKKVEESTRVVHFAGNAEKPEVVDSEIEGKDVSFEADGFSIYAVIGTGDVARLTVNFYGAKDPETGDYTLIDTMYVKKADQDSLDRIAQIVNDPGAGNIPEGYSFYGWSIGEENYSIAVDGSTNGSSIEDVRKFVQAYKIPEGDTGVLDIYAMLATHYTVRYIDLDGLSLGTETAMVKTDGEEVSYTVNMNYSHDTLHDFEGWFVHEGSDKITDPSDVTPETLFKNGTTIKITGSVEFSVCAPEGHWLIFDENGEYATYNSPRFVKSGEDTTDEGMLTMERKGYKFDGWWTGAPSAEGGTPTGERFEFGHPIDSTMTVYAKWDQATEANYTVIVWKEGITEGTFDFDQIHTFTGTVGHNASAAIVQKGDGRNKYVEINGTDYRTPDYKGFSYSTHDQNVTITPEGDAVVNVRYIRNKYTLTFEYGFGRSQDIQARYGTYIGNKFPLDITFFNIPGLSSWIDRNFGKWHPENGDSFTNNLVYIDIMPHEDVTFSIAAPGWYYMTMNYYVEVLPGEQGTHSFRGKQFIRVNQLHGRYNYFSESEDYLDLVGYDKFDTDPKFDSNGQITDATTLNCYYTRQIKTINYMNGSYYNGDNMRIRVGSGQLGTAEGILYDSDISSYNRGGDKYFKPTQEGFVFEGWYVDRACTVPYTFNKMPSGGITVYAKWRQVEYRVFLRPNAENDASLNWGSDTVKMNFRVAYGDKISLPEGRRTGYKFYGWHKDKDCTIPVFASALVLNKTEVPDDEAHFYDKTLPENMTDPNDKWGTYGTSNADVDRWWITNRFELFAKWGQITVGADGIGVVYVAGEDGTNPPNDVLLYQDNTSAVAGAAPKAKAGKVFKQWIVQEWNGSDFVDTDVKVLPGQKFDVKAKNAKIVQVGTTTPISLSDVVDDGVTKYIYTVQVRAEYSDAEELAPTHITWYKNDGSGESYRTDGTEEKPLKINETVSVYGLGDEGVPTRKGYTFLGWAKADERPNLEDDPNTSTSKIEADFLVYNDQDGKFYLPGTTTEITEVAADEVTPYEALYAIWEEKNEYFIYHHYVGGSEKGKDYLETCPMPESGTVNLAEEKITKAKGYMYGGYWDYTGEEKRDQILTSGLTFAPTKHQYIYLKEVSTDYLKPNFYLIYNKDRYNGLIQKIFVMYDVDNANDYLKHYLVIDKTHESEITNFAKSINVTSEGEPFNTLTAKKLFNVDTADMGFIELDGKEYVKLGKLIDASAYYVTKDNVKVTGPKNRRIQLSNDAHEGKPTFTGWKSEGGNTKIGIVNVASEATAYAGKGKKNFTVMRTMMIEAPSEKPEYTITKVYDNGTEEEIFEEGDYKGAVSFKTKDGYLFAGWYMDSAYTIPADFSNVNSDMAVYAKYVKKTDISVSFSRKSYKSSTAIFNTVVNVKGQSEFNDVTVNTERNDAVLNEKTVMKSGSGKNIRYTTQYKGIASVDGLSLIDSFTASVVWTTPDGTVVSGPDFKCTYVMGRVIVR